MSTYEEDRQKQIRENVEFLASLGIEGLAPTCPPKRKRETTKCKRRDDDEYKPEHTYSIRKRSSISYREDDYYKDLTYSFPRKKTKSMSAGAPRKRQTDPGRRVVGGRVYDSRLGSTCHQCRQKTMDRKIRCSNAIDGRPCTVMFDYKCLLNRYGEDANEIDHQSWVCPKCCGTCNCSFCMKKRGKRPTGQLSTFIKVNGLDAAKKAIESDKISDSVLFPEPPRRHKRGPLDHLALESGDELDDNNSADAPADPPTKKYSFRKRSEDTRESASAFFQSGSDDSDLSEVESIEVESASEHEQEGKNLNQIPSIHIWDGWESCPVKLNCIVLV